jgi:hypothetical protein
MFSYEDHPGYKSVEVAVVVPPDVPMVEIPITGQSAFMQGRMDGVPALVVMQSAPGAPKPPSKDDEDALKAWCAAHLVPVLVLKFPGPAAINLLAGQMFQLGASAAIGGGTLPDIRREVAH